MFRNVFGPQSRLKQRKQELTAGKQLSFAKRVNKYYSSVDVVGRGYQLSDGLSTMVKGES